MARKRLADPDGQLGGSHTFQRVMTLKDPRLRYKLFSHLNRLLDLWQAMGQRPLNEWDGELTETLEQIHLFAMSGVERLVGDVLYCQEEAEALRRLDEVEVDFDRLQGPWPDAEAYLRSPHFEKVFKAADACWVEMFREGRGLPGWDQDDKGQSLRDESQS